MNKDYVFPKPIFDLLTAAMRKYQQPENRLYLVLQHKNNNSNYRKFLTETENIKKVINILYENHDFHKESEYITIENCLDLLFRFYQVNVYNQEDVLLGRLVSYKHLFYFKYEGTNEYSIIKLKDLIDTLSDLKLESSSFNGNASTDRYVRQLKEANDLVKFKI